LRKGNVISARSEFQTKKEEVKEFCCFKLSLGKLVVNGKNIGLIKTSFQNIKRTDNQTFPA